MEESELIGNHHLASWPLWARDWLGVRRGSSRRGGGGPLSPSIAEILETLTMLRIRKELQPLKGNKYIILDS